MTGNHTNRLNELTSGLRRERLAPRPDEVDWARGAPGDRWERINTIVAHATWLDNADLLGLSETLRRLAVQRGG